MSGSVGVFFNDNGFIDQLGRAVQKAPRVIDAAVKTAAAQTLGFAKREFPKRSGEGANSFTFRRVGPNSYSVYSSLGHVSAYEFGSRATVITPKRKKYLLFTTDPKKADKTGRVREASRRNFFQKLKKAKSGQEKFNIMKSEGIFLSKRVNKPAMKGKFFMRDRVSAFAQIELQFRVSNAIDEVLR